MKGNVNLISVLLHCKIYIALLVSEAADSETITIKIKTLPEFYPTTPPACSEHFTVVLPSCHQS